jgi:hypothetical protein
MTQCGFYGLGGEILLHAHSHHSFAAKVLCTSLFAAEDS